MTFYYYMYGRHVAQLNVYVQTGLSFPGSKVWTRQGTKRTLFPGLAGLLASMNIYEPPAQSNKIIKTYVSLNCKYI
jgi:hypothetical protein